MVKYRMIALMMWAITSLTAIATTLVVPPTGVTPKTYYYLAYSYETSTNPAYTLQVAVDDDRIYIKGLCQQLPEAWIEGQMTNNVALFPSGQYLGEWEGSGIYMNSSTDRKTTQPLEIIYDPRNDTFEAYYQYLIFCRENVLMDLIELQQNMSFFGGGTQGVEPPFGLSTKSYVFEASNSDNGSSVKYPVEVGQTDDGHMYIQGICREFPDAWIEGDWVEPGVVSFRRNQHLGFLTQYKKDIWFTGIDKDEAYFTAIEFHYDDATGIFAMPENHWMVFNGDPAAYHYYLTLLDATLTPAEKVSDDPQPIVPPADMSTVDYTLTGMDYTFGEAEPLANTTVKIGRRDNTLYIQGLFADMPEAWISGTVTSPTTVQIPASQYLGLWYGDIPTWMLAVTAESNEAQEFTLNYDPSTFTYTMPENVRLAFDNSQDKATEMALSLYGNIRLQGTEEAAVRSVTLNGGEDIITKDLLGRTCHSSARGIVIRQRKALIQ